MAIILGCNVRVGMEDGYYIRRPREIIAIGYLAVAEGFFFLGRANSVLMIPVMITLCTLSALLYMGFAMTLIGRWYPRKKGGIMGFATSCSILSTLVLLPLLQKLSVSLGMASATMIFSIAALVILAEHSCPSH